MFEPGFDQAAGLRASLPGAHAALVPLASPAQPSRAFEWLCHLAAELAARTAPDAQALRERPSGAIVRFDMTPLAVSATDIRARLARGERCRYLLPDEVFGYIRLNRLY